MMKNDKKIKVRTLAVAKKTSLSALGLGLLAAGMVCVGLSVATAVQAQSMVPQASGNIPAHAVILAEAETETQKASKGTKAVLAPAAQAGEEVDELGGDALGDKDPSEMDEN